MNASNVPLSGLARRLVHDNILAEEVAQEVQNAVQSNGKQFVSHLIDSELAESLAVAEAAADEFGTPLFDLDAFNPELFPKDLVDTKLISKHHTLPLFRRGNRLFLAVSDPTNLGAMDEIKFHTGISTDAVLVEEKALNSAITKFVEARETEVGGNFDDLADVGLEDLDIDGGDDEDENEADTSNIDDTPLVRFVNKMLLDAIRTGASDIHFEPYEKSYRIRFRTDGILHEVTKPPQNLAAKMSARLKVMSRMDISERRLPQDGRIKMKLSKTRAIDFRVNTLPTLFGEKIVLRILDPASASLGIDALGFEEDSKEHYMKALFQPQGMMLFTGPTGSGKTVSLYTGLGILNTPERNISTAEDPVEINMAGINQVHVAAKYGLSFAETLRAFLRQDPDVIMVGEIRDLETGEIAVKAAQTGHMVLSTLHTNSAAETITRMLNMGIAPFNVATSVNLIVAQRLARRLCSNCAEEIEVPEATLRQQGFTDEDLEIATIRTAHGCDKCLNGYKGRVGIYEAVPITEEISRLIMEGGNSILIDKQARAEGFPDLRRAALIKCTKGLISLEEVNRVTKD